MKKKIKLALSKETLRVLTQGQLPAAHGGATAITTTNHPDCILSDPCTKPTCAVLNLG